MKHFMMSEAIIGIIWNEDSWMNPVCLVNSKRKRINPNENNVIKMKMQNKM